MTSQPVIPKPVAPAATQQEVLESSVSNAVALWRAFAAARRHHLIDEPPWLVVDSGNDVGGTRVILRGPVTGAAQKASLVRLVENVSRPVVVEDPFATVDLQAEGFDSRPLSVMGAGPFAPDGVPTGERADLTVSRVDSDEARLLEADRVVVDGFPLTSFQPYLPGRMLPARLLHMPHVSIFVANVLGTPCGACMTVKDGNGVGGIYWVAVLPEHRSTGVGRALMLAAMQELAAMPMVLCATALGAPLYRKLGFQTALESTYWSASNPS